MMKHTTLLALLAFLLITTQANAQPFSPGATNNPSCSPSSATCYVAIGGISIGDDVGSGTAGSVFFIDASGNVGQDNTNFFWDDSNNVLGIGTNTPDDSSILDLTSTTQGFLMPRVTTAQRDAISGPATGLMIYNTSTSAFNVYNGAAWAVVGGSDLELYDENPSSPTANTVTGFNALAIGEGNNVSGIRARALGQSNTASGQNALALGSSSTASATNAIAIGAATASGQNALALGSSSTASGQNALALGSSSTASGQNALVFGTAANASGEASLAAGYFLNAYSFVEAAFGIRPTTYTPNNATGRNISATENDRLFVIGNGYGNYPSYTPSDALTILKNGNMGLGIDNFEANDSDGSGVFAIGNADTAPTTSITNGILLYAEDVSSSSELKVRDEAGNTTTLSPHNFTLFTAQDDAILPWSYYSRNNTKNQEINVDMYGAIKAIQDLSGTQFIYAKDTETGEDISPTISPLESLALRITGLELIAEATNKAPSLKKVRRIVSDAITSMTELVVDRVVAKDELCVGETCVSEAEFIELLEGGNTTETTEPIRSSTSSSLSTPQPSSLEKEQPLEEEMFTTEPTVIDLTTSEVTEKQPLQEEVSEVTTE